MKYFIKNATDVVAFLFDVIKESFKIHFKIKSTVHNTKSGRRFIAGELALILILATLLNDVSVAYAQTGTDFIPVENEIVTEEKSLDEEIKEDKEEEKNSDIETSETNTTEINTPVVEVLPDEKPSSDTPQIDTPVVEVLPDKDNTDEIPKIETPSDETPSDETVVDEISSDESAADEKTDDTDVISEESKEEKEESEDTEQEDENKEPEKMPAISIEKTVDDYVISIECSEGTFAEGTTVEIKKVEGETEEEVDRLVEHAITGYIDIVKIVAFDVTFYDKDGKVVEPADKNSVSVKIVPSEHDKEELEHANILDDEELACSVFHIEDDEKVEEIECEVDELVEEVTFEAESFSVYSIVWYIKGDDGNPQIDVINKGSQKIGGFVKSTHTFIDFILQLEFLNEGNPVDKSLRPEEFVFDIYGRDATGGDGVDHDEVLICQVTAPCEYYNDTAKTITLKQSGKSKTEIPVYVVDGTQAQEHNGTGEHVTAGFEYTVKLVGTGASSIYAIKQDTTGINISWVANETEWTGNGNQKLSVERESLLPKKFYVSWIDNRNKAGKRPYSTVDDFKDEAAKAAFKSSVKLYRQVGDGPVEAVTDSMLPTTLEASGPIVGRKEGKSISDWEIVYNNLPTVSDGKPIKYYITVDDSSFKDSYSAVMPEGSVTIAGGKKAFLSDSTAKYIYAEDFTAKVEWYDANNEYNVRLTPENLAKEFVITDDKGNIVLNGETDWDKVKWEKVGETETEWTFKAGPLPMYNEQGDERSYNLVLKDGVIQVVGADSHRYEYSVDYSNVPKTTAHNNCLSGGKIILVIDRPLDSFKITKKWTDNYDYDKRQEAVEAGVRFLLWRYPVQKKDSEGNVVSGSPADRAAVFNPETHAQYTYTFKMNDPKVVQDGKVKDSTDITLEEFGVTEEHPVDMFDQNGYKYVYFATEVMSKTGYKTVYKDFGEFASYSEYGVMNGGTMTNVRQEKMKMEGIVKWNVPSVNDYTKTTVTIELQSYDEEKEEWVTLPNDDGKVYTKTLSGFTVTNPKRSHIFPEVERFDENGKEIKYRVIQTNVNYSGVDITVNNYKGLEQSDTKFVSDEFEMNEKMYRADAAPTLETSDSYTIENRLAGDTELILTKFWKDSSAGNGFGKNKDYKDIIINVFQHGTSANYTTPYMTITTAGSAVENFGKDGGVSANSVPYKIVYRDDLGRQDEEGVVKVTKHSESDVRAAKWEFKKEDGETLSNIFLPAFNENGNAYSYTIEEVHVNGAYTEYSYERRGNELVANVTNTYAEDGGNVRTVVFQKEWIDGTDIPQEKPLEVAIVRIDADGNFITSGGKIDLTDKNGKTHIVTLKDNNNWYGQLGINLNDFDFIDTAAGKKYLYTAIELDMARNGASDFPREVKYDTVAIAAKLNADINHSSPCNEFTGSIDAYLDLSHEENHLPGYDVTVKAFGTSVIDASKYVVENKRKGKVNVVFDKTWQDGSNSENTRTGIHKVYLYQNGKKVVETPISDNEIHIDGIISPLSKEYTNGIQENTHNFSFEDLPQYDNDGNIYHYSVKEFLEKDGKELEIALTDTKDSTKSGYVITNHSEETQYSISENSIPGGIVDSILVRNDTYNYTNTITGEKTGGAKFYVLWHDQTSYDKGVRPDVNYVLYYKTKGSTQDPQVYKGEYKVEWHPMYDDADAENPSIASRYYQYINFTKLPLANDEGVPYEYYAVPSLNNPGDHYVEEYYESYKSVMPAMKDGQHITTSAGRYHYDITPGTTPLGTNMLPENGVVEYTIDEKIHVEGNKIWKIKDNGEIDPSKLPDAKIYLWRESDHDKGFVEDPDVRKRLAETVLNDDETGYKTGYAFKTDGKYNEYDKYDKYGQVYNYTVTEKIFINSTEYQYSIPDYVMNYRPETNGITNVYNPEDEHNLRMFTVSKDWNELTLGTNDKKPVAEFRLYRVEIPFSTDYYNVDTDEAGNKLLGANPKKDAYKYAINAFNNYKSGTKGVVEEIGTQSIAYGAEKQSVVWNDMPIFAPSGLVYLYFAEELSNHGIESFKYGVVTDSDTIPAVKDIDNVSTDADRTNVLISYGADDSAASVRAGAVLFSNYGLNPSGSEDDAANKQEAAYKNEFKAVKFGKIVGYKTWDDGIFKDNVRPKIGADKKCPEVILTLKRSAKTQTGYGNQVSSETIDSAKYVVNWYQESDANKWRFELTPIDSANEFKLYATNGRAYTYSVTETIKGTTLTNYTIAKQTVTGTEDNVIDNVMTLSSSLQNKLKGQIKVFKKWDDALNELKLRAGYVNVLLQYRLVPDSYGVGVYNESSPSELTQWKNYRDEVYRLEYTNKWEQTVTKLPVKTITIDGINYRYEYRLLETAFNDLDATLNPVDVSNLGKVPNGGLCTDSSSETERNTLYGNSTSPDEKYHNKSYEIKIGNYIVNNSAISSLADNTNSLSSMELRVDNRLAHTTSLKIEKKWDGVNVGEAVVTPEDTYGVLPNSLTFNIEYKKKDDGEDQWKTLLEEVTGNPVTRTVYKNEDNSFVFTVDNLPQRSSDGKPFVYRAIERSDNLGRFEANPDHHHDPALIDGDRTICHTVVTNTLPYRDITIKKKWNAEDELRKQVTIELWSDNFTKSASEDTFSCVKSTENTILSAANGWEVTYANLPVYNTKHEMINYYVKEVTVGGSNFDINKYAIHFYDQISELEFEEVVNRYSTTDTNIAPVPETAYKMFIVNTPKTSLKVTKKWEDEENRQGIRESVKVTLTDDANYSVPSATQILGTSVNSSVTWNYLPIYKKPDADFVKGSMAHMDKVNYTITEADTLHAKGYEIPEYSFGDKSAITDSGYKVNLSSDNNNATITNTYHPTRIKFTASKEWQDEENRHYSRPVQKGIYLTLHYSTDNKNWKKVNEISSDYIDKNYPDGLNVYTYSKVTQHITDNGTDTWGTPLWEGLPTKAANKAIYYKAFETDASGNIRVTPGYSASYSPASLNVVSKKTGDTVSQVVTNKLELTSMLVSKEWLDTYDVNDRPDAVSFVLEYRCGDADSWRVYKNADGSVLKATISKTEHKAGSVHIWEKTIENLPSMNSEGKKYEYRVKEISITYGSDEVLAYNVETDEVSHSIYTPDGDGWKSESTVGTYKNSVVTQAYNSGKYSYKVTAVNTPVTGTLTVVKKWDDECNRDNIRPHEIKLQLYRKQDQVSPVKYGEAVVVGPGRADTTVTDDGNEWSYTFRNLPVYNNDAYEHTEENKSIYYVMEVDSEHGYEVSYTNESGVTADRFDGADNILDHNAVNKTYSATEIITNKHTPVRIEIKAHKEWNDENNSHSTRPPYIKFKLQYHIVGESDTWNDVESVASESALDTSGMKVQIVGDVERTLRSSDSDRSVPPYDLWESDGYGKPIIWENLPAYVNVIKDGKVESGKKVEYRLLENDGVGVTDYTVVYDHCEYEVEYGTTYSLKATNIYKDMGKILEVEKKWDPDYKDDIAKNDKTIKEIICHIEYKNDLVWARLPESEIILSHDNNWQGIFMQSLFGSYEYKVVEDAIVYKDGEKINADTARNMIGSFAWEVSPATIEYTSTEIMKQAVITNTIPDKQITVSKVWDDENNRDGKRTHSIKVCLKRDGEKVGEDIILYPTSDGSSWEEYTWHNLPIYKNGVLKDGELVKSKYTVEEIVDEEFKGNYKISYRVGFGEKTECEPIEFGVSGTNNVEVSIINRHETHKETIIASKNWKDENNKYNTRPTTFVESLLGKYHTYLMLIYKLEGQENWHPVKKYEGLSDADGKYQYPDNDIYTTSDVIQEVIGDNGEEWKNVAKWENVSTRGANGASSNLPLEFMVIEVPKDYTFPAGTTDPKSIAPAGYKVSEPPIIDPEDENATKEFVNITNTLITTSLDVNKTWNDQDNQFITRPDSIKVKLERRLKGNESDLWHSVKQNGNDAEIVISASGDWKGSVEKLPLCDNDGNEYIYRAVETALIYSDKEVKLKNPEELDDGKLKAEGGNYISIMNSVSENSVSGAESTKYSVSMDNILNDTDVDTTSVTVIKKWKDENDRDRVRPNYITVNLLRDGVIVDTQIITGPEWAYTWSKLPKYQNGQGNSLLANRSVYEVTEDSVAGYETAIVKSANNQYTITNTHIPKKAVITADKIWEDATNTYLTRPKEIYLRLLYKYADEGDDEYRVVPEYSKTEFDKDGMYTSEGAEEVFTTSKSTQKCTGKDGENWANVAKWENLPLRATPNGLEYEPETVVYKVIEVPGPDAESALITSTGVSSYEASDVSLNGDTLNTDSENNVKITNSLVTVEHSITKVFADEENKYNTRPDSIEVQILRRAKSSSADAEWQSVKVKGGLLGDDLIVNLTKGESFSKKLSGLPKYDKDGNEYEYTCLEKSLIIGDKKVPVDKSNVAASYTALGSDTKITNTLITTSLTVEKEWDDNSNKRKARPEKIVFNVERKETKDILSQIISELTQLLTGKDGYSELKMLKDGKEETVEIVIEGPEFNAYTLDGLPAYSEDGNLYSYRAIETKFVYADREVLIEKGTSLYKKPVYQIEAIDIGKDANGNTIYKFSEKVVNKIIPIKPKPDDDPEPNKPTPVNPVPVPPVPVNPPPKFEIIGDVPPELLPEKVIEKIDEIIDLPDGEDRKEKEKKLYDDLIKILSEDPTFLDKLDPETADIIRRFLATGVLGRKRSRLPKTGGVVGSVALLLFGSMLIGLGMAVRPEDEADKKKRHKSDRKA